MVVGGPPAVVYVASVTAQVLNVFVSVEDVAERLKADSFRTFENEEDKVSQSGAVVSDRPAPG
jgi:hypothetical protein